VPLLQSALCLFWFCAKTAPFCSFIWIRGTLAALPYDQLMGFA